MGDKPKPGLRSNPVHRLRTGRRPPGRGCHDAVGLANPTARMRGDPGGADGGCPAGACLRPCGWADPWPASATPGAWSDRKGSVSMKWRSGAALRCLAVASAALPVLLSAHAVVAGSTETVSTTEQAPTPVASYAPTNTPQVYPSGTTTMPPTSTPRVYATVTVTMTPTNSVQAQGTGTPTGTARPTKTATGTPQATGTPSGTP